MRERHITLLLSIALATGTPGGGLAAQWLDRDATAGGGEVGAAKAFSAARVSPAGDGVRIDGQLTDPVWQRAAFRSDFRQKDPVEGGPPTLRTEVAFGYDDEALYVAARMESPRDELQTQMSRRDNVGNADRIKISFDSYYDRLTAYTFGVSASGVRVDYYHATDNEFDRDDTFDPVWEAATTIDSTGWTAEMRIPFSQMRFNAAEVQKWGVNINRYIPARNEDLYWVVVPRQETGWSSRFGDLEGIAGVAPTRRVELLPYVTSTATFTGDRNPANPFDDGRNLEARAGADLKVGLGPGLTLDATVNPDFGQVEADPAVVNLSAVETFFEERRPFFTEGSQFFSGDGAAYYYSRRIGAPPPVEPGGDFVDMPKAATILGAAKVSGRLPSGTSIGTLVSLTGREYGRGYDSTTGATSRSIVAPLSAFGVARIRQELGADASTVGLTVTGVRRDLPDDHVLADDLNRAAVAGGVDWNLRFSGGRYVLQGAAGFSHILGSPEAILAQQTSSRRYYQRPDQGYVSVDSGRTSLTGYQASLSFDKLGGKHWLYGGGASLESPAFEINDVGRLGRADDIDAWAGVTYRETSPGRFLRNYSVGVEGVAGWNFGGVRQYNGVELGADAQFLNFMGASFDLEVFPSALSDELTRGGPLMKTTDDVFLGVSLSSGFAASTQWDGSLTYGFDEVGGSFFEASAEVEFRPSSRLQVSIEPQYSRSVDTRQFITQRAGDRPEVYNGRYIFGRIDRHTLSAQVRLGYAFTPDLTVELYAEPFAASGTYDEIGELRAARTKDLRLYGTDGTTITQDPDGSYVVQDGGATVTFRNPDFHVLSFRTNLVLRWEWRPGSTAYLVWQQNRADQGEVGRAASLRSFADSFSGRGDNFLALKVSYWLPVS